MSRAIENYVCASEDRSHYNTDDPMGIYGFYYGIGSPYIQTLNVHYDITPTEEQLKRIVEEKIPEVRDQILEEVGEVIVPAISNDEIDEMIYERMGL